MTPAELTNLETQASTLFTKSRTAYLKIPKAIRNQRSWADLRGFYENGWPDPKPETVVAFLESYAAWSEVRSKIVESYPPNLKLAKQRRSL